jgi:hypothetical protein
MVCIFGRVGEDDPVAVYPLREILRGGGVA